jgi:transposase
MEQMSQEQWKRLDVLRRLEAGALSRSEAAQVLGLTKRQVRRLVRAFEREGRRALVHGNLGREPANKLPARTRERIAALQAGKYAGFNDQHFTEKLELEGMAVSRSTVRRVLREAGVPAARKRRPPRHRRRRDRRAQEGMMMLWDGSRHEWLEERGPPLCLMGAIDDATGAVLPGAHFVEQECAAGYLKTLRRIAEEKGLPLSAYMDQHGSLKRNDDFWTLEEELRGEQDPTQVGRALRALGIEVIYALSPQAKGRVERLWGTLQDRLVSELRLAGAKTCAEANAVLEHYRADHNARFAVAPRDAASAWRPVRQGLDLDRVCSFHYTSTVLNDNTVRIGGRVIDIPPGPGNRSYAQAKVEVRQLLDGTWRVYLGERLIATAAASGLGELRAIRRTKKKERGRTVTASTCWQPTA